MTESMDQNVITRQREAEGLLVGAAMIGGASVRESCGWLKPDIMLDSQARRFWAAFLANGGEGIAAAVETDCVTEAMELSAACPSSLYAEEYARKIATENATLRAISHLPAIAKAAANGMHEEVGRLLREASAEKPVMVQHIPSAADIHEEFCNSLREKNRTVFTGIPPIDKGMGGLWRKNLIIVAARPSMGKTALLLQIARNVAASGKRVYFASLEMSRNDLWARMACGDCQIDYRDVQAERASDAQLDQLEKISAFLCAVYGQNLLIDDCRLSTEDIWQRVAQVRPDLIIMDHARLAADRHENEVKRLGIITQNMKLIAKEFDASSVVAVQLNRQSERREDHEPTLADIRDSGEIEENGDTILGMYRPEYYEKRGTGAENESSLTKLIPLKFRGGNVDMLMQLSYWLKHQWFTPVGERP